VVDCTFYDDVKEVQECFAEGIQEKVEKDNISEESITRIDYMFKPDWASVIFFMIYN
jgi:hypothetical protein